MAAHHPGMRQKLPTVGSRPHWPLWLWVAAPPCSLLLLCRPHRAQPPISVAWTPGHSAHGLPPEKPSPASPWLTQAPGHSPTLRPILPQMLFCCLHSPPRLRAAGGQGLSSLLTGTAATPGSQNVVLGTRLGFLGSPRNSSLPSLPSS